MNYPLQSYYKGVFGFKQSLKMLRNVILQEDASFDDTSVIGNFIDNHQTERFGNFAA